MSNVTDGDILTNQPLLPALSAGMTAEVQKAVQENRDRMVWIKDGNPRDEAKSFAAVKILCQNKHVAEKAEYAVPVGGSTAKGPTIHLMKAIAQKWGRIDYGIVYLYETDTETCIRVYARDLMEESSASETLVIKHRRYTKSGGYQPITDPDSIYRHVANRASKRIRECIRSIIPSYVVDEALKICKSTRESGLDLAGAISTLLKVFQSEFSVSREVLEKFMNKSVNNLDSDDLDSLRSLYGALKDGETTVYQVFNVTEAEVVAEPPKSADAVTTSPAVTENANTRAMSNTESSSPSTSENASSSEAVPATDATAEEDVSTSSGSKRTRRTKAQIEADKLAAEAPPAEPPVDLNPVNIPAIPTDGPQAGDLF